MRDHLGNFQISNNMHFATGILCLDPFLDAMNWAIDATGGDDVHELNAEAAFFGATGLKLKTRTASAAQYDYIVAEKALEFPTSGLLVYRAKLRFADVSNIHMAGLVGVVNADSNAYGFALVLMVNGTELHYQDSTGSYVAIADTQVLPADNQWATLELVTDLRLMQYISAKWNGVEYSLAGLSFAAPVPDSSRGCRLRLSAMTDVAAPIEMHVDCVYAGEFLNI